jgi:hypothetical protein
VGDGQPGVGARRHRSAPLDHGRCPVALLVPTLLAALAVWLIARRRAWPFWLLVLAAAPFFWALRAVAAQAGG